MCGPKFCSMKITQDVRDYAATLNDKGQGLSADLSAEARRAEAEALAKAGMARQEAGSAAGATGTSKENVEAGMASMSKKFLDMGVQVYVDKAEAVKESNKAL
jgi:phosphomethylpyrimidine synthase